MIRVGCCGFPTSMKKYFEKFNLVELNSTFYQCPRERTVEGWRERAPKDFIFTVKAHQDISHSAKMRAEEASLLSFERMKKICETLNAKILLFQTPGSFKPERLGDAEKFFRAVNREDLFLVWETRGPAWENQKFRKDLEQFLKELNITHVTDPFRIVPAYTGEIAYFRLHGLGERMYYYQYTDMELRKLKELIVPYEGKVKEIYVLFNNLAMFEDGVRFTQYMSKNIFPKVTGAIGLGSIMSIVEKMRYPITKNMLIKKHGWKLVEVQKGKQARFETLLTQLPSKSYNSAEELVNELNSAKIVTS